MKMEIGVRILADLGQSSIKNADSAERFKVLLLSPKILQKNIFSFSRSTVRCQ